MNSMDGSVMGLFSTRSREWDMKVSCPGRELFVALVKETAVLAEGLFVALIHPSS